MKKIMMAAIAAFGIAGVSTAANLSWAFYTDGEPGSATFEDWTGAAISDATPATMLLFAIDSAITYNGSAFNTEGAVLVDSRTYGADGLDGWGSAYDEPAYTTSLIDAKASQKFQIILVQGTETDLSKLADGTWYASAFITTVDGDESTDPGAPAGTYTGYTFYESETSIAKADWAQTAPEPTSGLLLLIGVAGLALRRRRA